MKILGWFLVVFEVICSSIGFMFIVMVTIALLSKDGCLNVNSPLFGEFKKEACEVKNP